MKNLKKVNTIDLWTEQHDNQYECFNGAFVDGFDNLKPPFDEYKIIKNCNCIITINNSNINITNKHHAIIFYNNKIPVRLVVINKNTDVEKCIKVALEQFFNGQILSEFYEQLNIKSTIIDMDENPIFNKCSHEHEIDVGSCDRWNLLVNMLKGSYTESDTKYGNFTSDKYEFLPDINIKYELKTDSEEFNIEHNCAFINTIKTRIIIIQEKSLLTNGVNEL